MNQERLCNKCMVTKQLDYFTLRKHKGKLKYEDKCKNCRAIEAKELRLLNKSKPIIDNSKFCQRCNQYKNLYDFTYSIRTKKTSEHCIDCKIKSAIYHHNNKEIINPKHRAYHNENKEFINARKQKYNLEKYYSDPVYRIKQCLRSRLKKLVGTGKDNDELIGCSGEFIKEWLDYDLQFTPELTWLNVGSL